MKIIYRAFNVKRMQIILGVDSKSISTYMENRNDVTDLVLLVSELKFWGSIKKLILNTL